MIKVLAALVNCAGVTLISFLLYATWYYYVGDSASFVHILATISIVDIVYLYLKR